MSRFFRKYHKYLGLLIGFFLLFFGGSGIILNHRQSIASADISRKLLPQEYQYQNWNNGFIRGALVLNADSTLFYGNEGVWLKQQNTDIFQEWNTGFGQGADQLKVSELIQLTNGRLLAANHFGLFEYSFSQKKWTPIDLPITEKRIVSLTQKQNELFVLTRSNLLKTPIHTNQFRQVKILAHKNDDNKVSLFKTIWIIHSGEILGHAGKLLVDLTGLIFILLSVTGFIYFINPKLIKHWKAKSKDLKPLKRFNKKNLRIHNYAGIYLLPVLIVTAFTGMFLRPPLLIPIADKRVSKLPYTIQTKEGAWHDKLRKIAYDHTEGYFFLFTSEGIFRFHEHKAPEAFERQAPVSVMGINVFHKHSPGKYLVGSFSGLFLWDIHHNQISDYLNPQGAVVQKSTGRPIGRNMVAGYVKQHNNEVFFDYNTGATRIYATSSFPDMPEQMANRKMSLWNLALEIHTARIYKFMLGDFYILIVPLVGLFTLFVLVSGTYIWIKHHRRKKNVATQKQLSPEAVRVRKTDKIRNKI